MSWQARSTSDGRAVLGRVREDHYSLQIQIPRQQSPTSLRMDMTWYSCLTIIGWKQSLGAKTAIDFRAEHWGLWSILATAVRDLRAAFS